MRIIAPLLYVAVAGGAWTYHQLALRDARLITAESVAQDLAEQQRADRLFATLEAAPQASAGL